MLVLWRRYRLNHAARRYARELGPWLARSYGASDTYTPAQVGAGLARLKLPAQYAWLGYAAFQTEAEFDQQASGSNTPTYTEARALLQRHRPRHAPSAGGGFHESGIGLDAAGLSGNGHHGGVGDHV
jgi:hypothetical protein